MRITGYAAEYGLRSLIVRPGHVFGSTASLQDTRVSSYFAYEAAKGHDLVFKSFGSQVRSYMYCIDCAKAIVKVLKNGSKGEAYNICGRECVSIREMASFLANAGDVKLTYHEPTKEEIASFNPMDNSSLDSKKLFSLGFRPVFTIQNGLFHTVSALKELM